MAKIETSFPVIGSWDSRVGGRSENQDYCGYTDTPRGLLIILCDGMGGGPGGRTASSTVVEEVKQYMQDVDLTLDDRDALKLAISTANDALEHQIEEIPELKGMGTTIVALYITKESALIAHVGDSRLYQLRGKKVVFRTKDHSFVGEMVQNATLTEEQARLSAQSNIITRALGAGDNHEPDFDVVPYLKGDRFVLCSDGIWGAMPESELVGKLVKNQELDKLVDDLSSEVDVLGVSSGGHHDNMTLVIADVELNSIMEVHSNSLFKKYFSVFLNKRSF